MSNFNAPLPPIINNDPLAPPKGRGVILINIHHWIFYATSIEIKTLDGFINLLLFISGRTVKLPSFFSSILSCL